MPFTIHFNPQQTDFGWAMATCDICRAQAHVAVGYRPDEITIALRIACARMMGWSVAPRLICPYCKLQAKLAAGKALYPGHRD